MPRGKAIGVVLGVLLMLASAGSFLFQLMAFADPAGAQAANDSDPFGVPPSRAQIALEMLLSVVIGACGFWLAYRNLRQRRTSFVR